MRRSGRADRSDGTREAILTAAETLFAEHKAFLYGGGGAGAENSQPGQDGFFQRGQQQVLHARRAERHELDPLEHGRVLRGTEREPDRPGRLGHDVRRLGQDHIGQRGDGLTPQACLDDASGAVPANFSDSIYTWTSNVVPYTLDSSFSTTMRGKLDQVIEDY